MAILFYFLKLCVHAYVYEYDVCDVCTCVCWCTQRPQEEARGPALSFCLIPPRSNILLKMELG